MPFLTVKSFSGCHDVKWALNLLKKAIFCPTARIPQDKEHKCRIFLIRDMRINQNLAFFVLPFTFPFSRPFYSRSSLRFIFILAAVKGWVLWAKPGNGTIFTTIKTGNVDFQFAMSECGRYPKPTDIGIDLF